MRTEFLGYMEEVLERYKDCDTAHNATHITAVWDRAQYIASCVDDEINREMLMCACYFHDLGCLVNRKEHNIYSGKMIREDMNLRKFFTEDEIEVIAEAAEDHRTSIDAVPRSIYGKIVKDADKDNDVDESLKRAYMYAVDKGIGKNKEERIEATFIHLNEKFGVNGSVKYYILPNEKNVFLLKMRELAKDKDSFIQYMDNLVQ